jgi:hypothetical protein
MTDLDGSVADGASLAMMPACRGPKGARIGDIVTAERSRWRVEALDPERREAICRLLGGSHCLRRFRARRITAIERAGGRGRRERPAR